MIENRTVTEAIRRSWNLTKGFWWQIFWVILIPTSVIGLALVIVSVILWIIFLSGFDESSFAAFEQYSIISQNISALVGALVGTLAGPIIALYLLFLFMSLVNLASEIGEGKKYVSSDASGKKMAAGICGILLGAFGIHKFVLGYITEGLIMLLVSILSCGLLVPVTYIIGIIEGVMYSLKSDGEFCDTYIAHKKGWF